MGTRAMSKIWAVAPLALVLMGWTAERAVAGPGTLTITGTMDGLLGIAPMTSAAFTAVANFSSAAELGGGGFSIWPATVTFTIAGVGTSVPLTGMFAVTIAPPYPTGYGPYGVELFGPPTVSEFFDTASTFLTPPGDTETIYSNPTNFTQYETFTIPLTGGGTFTETSFDSLGATATLIVPEPASLGLLAVGIATMARLRRRRV
jgi:hypothetical protein